MATPQIPGGRCAYCQAPIIDLFAEWTDEYQTRAGKQEIMAGTVVFDCYYCQDPLQLVLPLALVLPQKAPTDYRVAKRMKVRCEDWLRSQHTGLSLSQVVELASWHYGGKWAFDGYNWGDGGIHRHRQDQAPSP